MDANEKRDRITEMLCRMAQDLSAELDPVNLAAAFAGVALGVLAVRVYGGDMIAAAEHLKAHAEQLSRWHDETAGSA